MSFYSATETASSLQKLVTGSRSSFTLNPDSKLKTHSNYCHSILYKSVVRTRTYSNLTMISNQNWIHSKNSCLFLYLQALAPPHNLLYIIYNLFPQKKMWPRCSDTGRLKKERSSGTLVLPISAKWWEAADRCKK